MNQLNSIILEGNVVRAPEVKHLGNGLKVCKIAIAVNRFYKNVNGEGVNEVSYFDVETFKSLADACEKNCERGRGLRVVGRLKQNRWKGADGKNTSKISVIAEHIEFKPRFLKKDENSVSFNDMAAANIASTEEELKLECEQESEITERNSDFSETCPQEEAVF